MATQRQIDANRRNAGLSTGPQTPEGKAAVSRNRLVHGLSARDPVAPGEDQAEYEALLEGFMTRFAPADPFEESLVRQLASSEWRLRRVIRIETGLNVMRILNLRDIDGNRDDALDAGAGLTPEQKRYDENTRYLGRSFFANSEAAGVLDRLLRYENSLRRAFYKALEQLNARPSRPGPTPGGGAGPRPAASDNSKPISASPPPPDRAPLSAARARILLDRLAHTPPPAPPPSLALRL